MLDIFWIYSGFFAKDACVLGQFRVGKEMDKV